MGHEGFHHSEKQIAVSQKSQRPLPSQAPRRECIILVAVSDNFRLVLAGRARVNAYS